MGADTNVNTNVNINGIAKAHSEKISRGVA